MSCTLQIVLLDKNTYKQINLDLSSSWPSILNQILILRLWPSIEILKILVISLSMNVDGYVIYWWFPFYDWKVFWTKPLNYKNPSPSMFPKPHKSMFTLTQLCLPSEDFLPHPVPPDANKRFCRSYNFNSINLWSLKVFETPAMYFNGPSDRHFQLTRSCYFDHTRTRSF
jgi:hypothetical protein